MAEIDFSKPGYRPKVLTAEETAAKRAAEQQNNQTIANVNGQTINMTSEEEQSVFNVIMNAITGIGKR